MLGMPEFDTKEKAVAAAKRRSEEFGKEQKRSILTNRVDRE